MASIVIRGNNSTVTVEASTAMSSHNLAIYTGSTKLYVPFLWSSSSWVTLNGKKYSYDASKPTIAVYTGGQVMYMANTVTSASDEPMPDGPTADEPMPDGPTI